VAGVFLFIKVIGVAEEFRKKVVIDTAQATAGLEAVTKASKTATKELSGTETAGKKLGTVDFSGLIKAMQSLTTSVTTVNTTLSSLGISTKNVSTASATAATGVNGLSAALKTAGQAANATVSSYDKIISTALRIGAALKDFMPASNAMYGFQNIAATGPAVTLAERAFRNFIPAAMQAGVSLAAFGPASKIAFDGFTNVAASGQSTLLSTRMNLNEFGKLIPVLAGTGMGMNSLSKASTLTAEGFRNIAATGPAQMMKGIEGGANRMVEAMRRWAYATQIVGYEIKSLGDKLTQLAKDTLDTFSTFDFQVRRAAGALNIMDDQSPMFANLTSSIQETARAVKMFSISDIAKAMYYWGSTTGLVATSMGDLSGAMDQIIPALKVAAVTESDYETTLKSVYAVTQQYINQTLEVKDVTEKMFYTAQKTAIEFEDLTSSLKMVGPTASGLGVTFEETLTILGKLGNAGIRGSMAGRALRQMFIQLERPSARAAGLLDDAAKATYGLGVTWDGLVFPEGKFVGMAKYVNILTEMTNQMTEAQKNTFLATIGTANELSTLQVLVKRNAESMREYGLGLLEVEDANFNLADSNRVLEESMGLFQKSAKFALESVARSAEILKAAFGKGVMDAIKGPLLQISGFMDSISNTFANNPALTQGLASLTVALGALLSVIGTLVLGGGGFLLIGSVLGEMKDTLLRPIIENFKVLKSAIGKLGLETIPIVAAAVLVLGAAFGFMQTAGASVVDLFGGMMSVFGAVTNIIFDLVAGLFNIGTEIGKIVGSALAPVLDGFTKGLNVFAQAVGKAWDGIKGFTDIILKALPAATDAIGDFFMGVVDWARRSIPGLQQVADLIQTIADATTGGKGAKGPVNYSFAGRGGLVETPDAGKSLNAVTTYFINAGQKISDAFWQTIYSDRLRAKNLNLVREYADEAAAIAKAALDTKLLGFIEIGRQITTGLMTGMRSNNESVRTLAIEHATSLISQYVSTIDEKSKTDLQSVVQALNTNISKWIADGDNNIEAAGKGMMAVLAGAIASGDNGRIQTAVQSTLTTIMNDIHDSKGGVQRSARNMMAGFLTALNETNPDIESKGIIDIVINTLLSGTQAAANAGFAVGSAFVLELLGVVNVGFAKVYGQLSSGAAKMGAHGYNTGLLAHAGMTGEINSLMQMFKPIDNTGLGGKNGTGAGAGTGGGGGGGADQKSPLEKALEVAKNVADLAEALQKVAGLDVKKMVQDSMGKLAEAMLLADQMTYKVVHGKFTEKQLQEVATFADTTGKVATTIGTAIDSFAKLKDYKGVTASQMRQIGADIWASMQEMMRVYDHFDKMSGKVAGTSVFAEQAQKVATTIGSAFESFSKITKYKKVDSQVFTDLANDIEASIRELGRVNKGLKGMLTKDLADFADNAQKVVTLFGSAYDTFSKIVDFKPVTPEQMTAVADSIELAINTLVVRADKINKTIKDNLVKLAEFATNANTVVTLFKNAYDTFASRVVKVAGEGEQEITPSIDALAIDMEHAIERINTMMASLETKGIGSDKFASIGALADMISKIGSAISSFFSLVGATGKEGDPNTFLNQIMGTLTVIEGAINDFISTFIKMAGESIVTQFAAGMKSQESALIYAVDRINQILSGVGGTATVSFAFATSANTGGAGGWAPPGDTSLAGVPRGLPPTPSSMLGYTLTQDTEPAAIRALESAANGTITVNINATTPITDDQWIDYWNKMTSDTVQSTGTR
jgi:TP901 family phage tail tape measure protein